MAGHSAWKNIKHKKAISDARKGKAWSKCMRAVIVAARQGGNPDANLALKMAIEEARAANVPKDTIEKGIKKGSGDLAGEGEQYEAAVYEGYGPGGVALLIEILTNNRQRTAPEIKRMLEDAGGNLGSTGCVAYIFQTRGQILVPHVRPLPVADTPAARLRQKNETPVLLPEDEVMEAALACGADDVADEGDQWQVLCEAGQLDAVRKGLLGAGLPVTSASLTRVPTMTVACTGDQVKKILSLMDELEEHEDVQKVYANFEIPDEELAGLK